MVRQGSRAADIGTDHAKLPVMLRTLGISPYVIATDVREGPAAAAAAAVERAGLRDTVEVRLGDGLSVLWPGEAEDLIIAGMGGENIADILHRAPFVRDTRYRLLLQPMTKPETLRSWLFDNGFVIEREEVARENSRLYTILQASFSGEVKPYTAAEVYLGKIRPTPDGAAYIQKELRRLRGRIRGLRVKCNGTGAELDQFLEIEWEMRDFCGGCEGDISVSGPEGADGAGGGG
jgi:tRNA (adenine22-N1)-methyltransferase